MATETRVSRWYFGGLASCGAACCTHPLDLLKVHLQTQQEVRLRMTGMALQVVRSDGILALYNGLSASLCRQMTYSLARFAIYETVRDQVTKDSQGPLPFYKKVLLGSISGCIGGFVGTPADMVNVRMQNDVKLPQNQRRNYAHALDGLYRVAREEGLKKLFSGATMASSRGMLVTVGQLSCYDQAKQLVLSTGYLSDGIFTHLVASFIAGGCATFLCQPLDVLKTRLMNAKGEYQFWSRPRAGAPPGPLGWPRQEPGRPLALRTRPALPPAVAVTVPALLARPPHMWGHRGPWQGSFWFGPIIEKSCSSAGSALPAGRSALRHGHCEAGATGLLQGPLPCWHPPRAPHRAHVRVFGTASQTLWHQGVALMVLGGAGWTMCEPGPASSSVLEGQQANCHPEPSTCPSAWSPRTFPSTPAGSCRTSLPGPSPFPGPASPPPPPAHPGSPHLVPQQPSLPLKAHWEDRCPGSAWLSP
ncbi:mitochondrial dicarboxylate carrier isoform X1 [Manis javanica]|uniref:mitochondrial dicarboxylate carrier isoform X1 n=1 Tax=Manis javanica TaxID=9974 RepID=UPI003C6DA792